MRLFTKLLPGLIIASLAVAATPWQPTSPATAAIDPDEGFTSIFNGDDLDGWYTYTPSQGKNNDSEGFFTAGDGELNILDVPVTDEELDFGYIATDAEYGSFHLRFEYQWGENKFAPREASLRDSGLLYHLVGDDAVWPDSIEAQVQEGDTGDTFLLGATSADSEVASGTSTYQAGGEAATDVTGSITASSIADTETGWNTVDVIVQGNSSTHIVNGVVVGRTYNQTLDGEPLTSGKIAFQAEGAEITYRNIEIKELPDETSTPRVLAYSETAGYAHTSITDALDAIDELGAANGFAVDRSEDSADFTDENLANYDAVIFVSTTGETISDDGVEGDLLTDDEQAAFEQYIRGGGGWVGIHAATDAEYDWEWYGELAGAFFDSHPTIQEASVTVEDSTDPSTAHLDASWIRTDEWYNFATDPSADVNVLLSVDESTYTGGTMGEDHPIAWYHEFDGGRAWYTGLGHASDSYTDPDFLKHLLGGIEYAIGEKTTPTETALDRSGWSFDTSSALDKAENAVDGDIATRWSSGSKQTPGMFFQVDLGSSQAFDRMELETDDSQPFDYPREYEVYASDDPDDLGELIATGVGEQLTSVDVSGTTAQYLTIVQTGSDLYRFWSIYELNLFVS